MELLGLADPRASSEPMTGSDGSRRGTRHRYRHEDLFDFGCACSSGSTCPPPTRAKSSGCLIEGGAARRRFARDGAASGLCAAACRRAWSRRGPASIASPRAPRRRSSTATTGSARSSARARWTRRCDLAREHGTGFVGVRNSNHFGPAAYYVEKAVERGCIGLAISNAPPNMAPFGGKSRFLGTNPLAIGMPAGRGAAADLRRVDERGRARQDHRRGAQQAADSRRLGDRSRRLSDDGRGAGARRRGAAIRRAEGVGDFVHHRYLLRRADRRGVRVAPEHARGSVDRAERRPCASPRCGRTCSCRTASSGRGWTRFWRCSKPRRRRPRRRSACWCPARSSSRTRRSNRDAGYRAGAGDRRAARRVSARSSAWRFPSPLAPRRIGVRSRMTVDAGQVFNFLPMPTDVHFGCGALGSLPDRVRALGGRRVFVVTDPGVRACRHRRQGHGRARAGGHRLRHLRPRHR